VTIFIISIVVSNAIEILTPIINRARKRKAESSEKDLKWSQLFSADSIADKGKSDPEKQYELTEFESTFDDWDEIAIQYGYLSLFVCAFPLAPLLAVINNILESYLDSKKLCSYDRRPLPRGAADIGFWYVILQIVSWLAMVTNIALVVFETSTLQSFSISTRFLIFLAVEHICILLKFGIDIIIPDESGEVEEHLARQAYLSDVLIGRIENPDDVEQLTQIQELLRRRKEQG